MSVGVAFASTGGNKIIRAIRSFRRSEPDVLVHVVLDTSSNTWKENSVGVDWLTSQPGVQVRIVSNTAYINGNLNHGMRWLRELGYSHGCLFHDDVIFSPMEKHKGHVSEWFPRVESDELLRNAAALSFGCMQAFVPEVWKRPSVEWDEIDLESEKLWAESLCPDGVPAGCYSRKTGCADEIHLPDFYVQYHSTYETRPWPRLGPTGQILPIALWEEIGEFDETEGIFYDIQYPAECLVRGKPLIQLIPNIPHLHLHNQTIGFADPAIGLWSDTMGAFTKRYGDYGVLWHGRV